MSTSPFATRTDAVALAEQDAAPRAVQRQPNGRFLPGQSGNPRGKLPGTRNRASLAADALLDGEAEALTRTAIALAHEGDGNALRLCLERISPKRKSRPIDLPMPDLCTLQDVDAAVGVVFQALAQGHIECDQSAALLGILAEKRKTLESLELDRRLRALEASDVTGFDLALNSLTHQDDER